MSGYTFYMYIVQSIYLISNQSTRVTVMPIKAKNAELCRVPNWTDMMSWSYKANTVSIEPFQQNCWENSSVNKVVWSSQCTVPYAEIRLAHFATRLYQIYPSLLIRCNSHKMLLIQEYFICYAHALIVVVHSKSLHQLSKETLTL